MQRKKQLSARCGGIRLVKLHAAPNRVLRGSGNFDDGANDLSFNATDPADRATGQPQACETPEHFGVRGHAKRMPQDGWRSRCAHPEDAPERRPLRHDASRTW
jgi:hypothetical protein